MNYKGFQVVEQTEDHGGWKWTVSFDADRTFSGVEKLRSLAVVAAMREIDIARERAK
jgi:hypothetical protein